jgi:hypothetical protein
MARSITAARAGLEVEPRPFVEIDDAGLSRSRVQLRAGARRLHRLHRDSPGRAAARDPVRPRGADHGHRHRRYRGGGSDVPEPLGHACMEPRAPTRARTEGRLRALPGGERRGPGFQGRSRLTFPGSNAGVLDHAGRGFAFPRRKQGFESPRSLSRLSRREALTITAQDQRIVPWHNCTF